ncbi:AI-2E family transporter [Pseudonocardia asaccharolytica]|uniref:AI-2E family transporter n=1 Tax=Pseudonocardia asaccharolytica DSM 44247 = NBRC 16224 TaxID=1123024 RepID=A0A511D4S1_9PSEU|nr:AI-2E family transporter [Pseudonocardia asaccharolytica]GEL19782.1 AI-2E family transporter [Pseudonocardia asaccharolytica DSM 44247 = NBRC 16224]
MTAPAPPHVALPRGLVVLLGAAAGVIVVAGMMAVSWLLGPVFLALVIVIAISPVQAWARRHGWPGWLSTLLLVILVYGVILSLVLVMVVSVAQLASLLPQYANQAQAMFTSVTEELHRLGIDPSTAKTAASSADLNKLAGVLGGLLSGVTSVLTSVVFLLALLLFLSAEASGMPARLAAIAADRQPMAVALRDFARGTRSYLIVTTVFGFIVAVLDTAALAILGVPLAILWGVLAFITNYIPNIGFILGLIPPALLALLSGGWKLMLWVIVVYCVLNLVIQSLIQPRFVGDSVGLSATVTFVALIFWAWVLGGLGALLAIPMTLLVKALLVDTDPRAGWVDALVRSPDRGKARSAPPGSGEAAAPPPPGAPLAARVDGSDG